MGVEQLGVPDGRRSNPERREGPRTALVLLAAGLLGLLAVGGVFWLVTAGLGGPGGGTSGSGGDQVAGPAAVSTSDTTTPDDGPTTITSTRTSTTTTSTTPRPSLDLPPPEQPTYTLPPTAPAVSTTTPGGGGGVPAPTTPAPRPTTAGPGGARVTDAKLSCTGNRKAVKAVLTFTTTAPVQAYVVGGGKVTSGVRGPGSVSMTASGNGTGYCLATVGGQTLGPVPAR